MLGNKKQEILGGEGGYGSVGVSSEEIHFGFDFG